MKKAVVTGATSFIGLHLVNRLLQLGYQVHAITRVSTAKRNLLPQHANLTIAEYNLADYKDLHQSVRFVPDVYFSLAWSGTRGADRDDGALQQANYVYSMNGLRSILGTGCKRVITAGSQAEYGIYDQKIDEQCLEKPITHYGKYKLKFYREALALCTLEQARLKEPRFFSVYGPHDFEHSMIQMALSRMLSNQPCYFTEANQMWDYLYIEDAVDAMIYLSEKPCKDGVYNVGSGIANPLKIFIEEMKSLAGSQSELFFGAIPYPKTGRVSIEPDITKLVTETGWKAKTSFAEGIVKVINSLNL